MAPLFGAIGQLPTRPIAGADRFPQLPPTLTNYPYFAVKNGPFLRIGQLPPNRQTA
jgi:hypothetical protein